MKNWFSVEMKSIFFQFRLKLHFSLLQTKLLLSLLGQNFDYTVINIVMNLFKVSNKRHRTTSIDFAQVSLLLNWANFRFQLPNMYFGDNCHRNGYQCRLHSEAVFLRFYFKKLI